MQLFPKTWHRALLVLALVAATLGWLVWRCQCDPKINFLPRGGRAEWILFPAAVDASNHPIAPVGTVFRRSFTLNEGPRIGRLNVRAANQVEVKINGARVNIDAGDNWKRVLRKDVVDLLRRGDNAIEARVFNDTGPPCLWLALEMDQQTVRSDENWEGSIAGSAWRHAVFASRPRLPGAGNIVAGSEKTFGALAKIWPLWIGFGAIALVICVPGYRWFRRLSPATAQRLPIILMSIFWLLLFWNNSWLMPYRVGFDSREHLQYIQYLQEHRALPLPSEGFEMFQPPLYYALSAIALSSFGLSVNDELAIVLLRGLTMLFGVAHFILVYLSMRLLFPNRTGPRLIGLLLAAFLPMLLYLSHFVTNETLAAALTTGTIYFALRLLKSEDASFAQYVVLGLCMGAAILAKTTSVLLLPSLLVTLSIKRASLANRVKNLGAMMGVCFAVCGWHYIRIGMQPGRPFLGVAGDFSWWQDPGYRTAADYIRFGRSLIAPLFSAFNGFGDGIYSTLWGDGLCGGVSNLSNRPPWNYDLMASGYLLSVAPTLIISIGIVVAVYRFICRPTVEEVLLLAFSGTVLLALIFMSLKVPAIAQAKAFFGLCALVPICFFGAIGWDAITRGRRPLQIGLATVLLVWGINSFTSVWIRSSASQHLAMALRLLEDGKIDMSVPEAMKAVDYDRSSAMAEWVLAWALDESGRADEAIHEAEKAIALSPLDSACHFQAAAILARQHQVDRGMAEARRAIELGPENVLAYELLLVCLFDLNQHDQAKAIARDALASFPFKAEFQDVFRNDPRD